MTRLKARLGVMERGGAGVRLPRGPAGRLLVALALWLPACAQPDVSGFVESTIAVRSSLAHAGSAFRPFIEQRTPDLLERFDEDWANVLDASDALVEYARSLDAIVAAGRTGPQGAADLAEGVDRLVGRVGGAGVAASEITAVIADVYGIAATAVAARRLSEAVGEAHPYVDAVCRILEQDVVLEIEDDLLVIYEAVLADIDDRYSDVAGNYERLIDRRTRLLERLAGADVASWSSEEPARALAQLEQVDAVLARLEGRREAHQRDIRAAELRRDAQRDLLRRLAATLRALAAEHATLRATVEAHREFSMTSVRRAAHELAKLVDQIREIESNG